MELEKMQNQLEEWMNLMKYGYRDSVMYMMNITEENLDNEVAILMKLYTSVNCYTITARHSNKGNYLGCQVSSRSPRAGEDWTRGNDLSDGEFSQETWNMILGDIVGNELVKIHRPISKLLRRDRYDY